MKCKLVDVFAKQKLSGNGLTIFYEFDDLATKQMQSLTLEMRQFESIFLSTKNGIFNARIFTAEEELDFAGHPLIGLAAHLHEEYGVNSSHDWDVEIKVSLKVQGSDLCDILVSGQVCKIANIEFV
jgi:PhzF family phenazine biosynthesis protein